MGVWGWGVAGVLTPLQTMHEKEQGKDNDRKTTDIIETDNQNQNESEQPRYV